MYVRKYDGGRFNTHSMTPFNPNFRVFSATPLTLMLHSSYTPTKGLSIISISGVE